MSNERYGRTEFGEVHILPELATDMSEGRTLPSGLGQTEMPVTVLPAWEIDMSRRVALNLTFRVTAGTTEKEIATDLKLAFDALSEYEISLGGKGLVESGSAADADGVRLVLVARHPPGATDRLRKLVEELNKGTAQKTLLPGRAFASCVAELTNAA